MTAFSEGMFQSELAKYYDAMRQFRDYDKESRFADTLIRRNYPEARRVLDVCCGTGGHAINIARFGYEVTGIDMSRDMLNIAEEKVKNAGLSVDFRCIDVTKLDVTGEYQAAYCLGYTFLYMTTYSKVREFFGVINKALVPGGVFLVDFINGWSLIDGSERDKFVYRHENTTIFQFDYSYLDRKRRIRHVDEYYLIDNSQGQVKTVAVEEDLRIFFEDEVCLLLTDSGFEKVESFGDYSLDADQPSVPYIVTVAGVKKDMP